MAFVMAYTKLSATVQSSGPSMSMSVLSPMLECGVW